MLLTDFRNFQVRDCKELQEFRNKCLIRLPLSELTQLMRLYTYNFLLSLLRE